MVLSDYERNGQFGKIKIHSFISLTVAISEEKTAKIILIFHKFIEFMYTFSTNSKDPK